MEKDFRIEAVTCRVLRPALSHQFHWLLDDPMATPVAHVPGMRDRRQLAPDLFGNILVEISLGNGSVGFALGVGGEPTRHVINQLAPLLRGKDGRNIAEHWHWMNRLCGFRTGLGGPSTLGISAIDLALWDLAGKLVGLPVAKLLGGKCPASLKIYATGPDAAAARALGFPLAKLTLPEGDTRAGLHRSIDFLMHQREAVGPDYPIAVDCWGGLEPALAAEFAAMVRPINLAWLEEPFIGEAVEHYRHLKRAAPWLTVASGEHVQSHREFIDLIEAGVDYIQPDLRWCGGITGARAISPLILERGRALMPHTAGVYSYHFAAGTPGCGMVEYSNPSPDGKSLPPYHGGEFIGEPLPDSGVVSLEDRPGFGLVKVEPQVSSWV